MQKKFIKLFIIVLMLFLLSSCAEKHPSNSINREEAEKEISENEFS